MFRKSAIAVKNGIFGSGTGPIWLDVSCSGNETSLFYCNKRSLGSTNCYLHNSDTGVDCQSGERINLVITKTLLFKYIEILPP